MKDARWRNAANLLTISRIFLAPFLVWQILARKPAPALAWLVIASITDLLDGLVARGTSTESEFGQLLDPVADKILLSGVFIALAWTKAVPLWFVAVVFGRDVVLLLSSSIAMIGTKYRKLQPTIYGKGSTLLQILTAAAIVGTEATRDPGLQQKAVLLIWPAAVLTLFSGLHYLARGLYYLWRR